MNSNLPNPIDPVDREIAERLAAAGADWQAVNTAELSKHQAMALQLLVWSGLLELRLTVRAWSGSSDTVVLAECIVSGDYRKALPDEIRKVAPSLGEGRVMVQPDAQVQFRLTISGTDARARLIETPMDPFVLVFAKRVLPGRVSVRIVNVEQAVRKDRPGAIAVAQAAASVGDIHVHMNPEIRLDASDLAAATKGGQKGEKPSGTLEGWMTAQAVGKHYGLDAKQIEALRKRLKRARLSTKGVRLEEGDYKDCRRTDANVWEYHVTRPRVRKLIDEFLQDLKTQ